MPFGLKGAPATFSRMMNSILGHMSPLQLVLYMDDLCVFSDSFHSHLERLEQVLQTLQSHGLRVNGKKCEIGMTKVVFFVDIE